MSSNKRHKVTIKMLSEYLGISSSTVYKWSDEKKHAMIADLKEKINKGEVVDPRTT